MPADTIYMLRHGDCRRDDVKRFVGRTDLPLNRTGRCQAEFWQRELAPIPFWRILCSDLDRSVETARIIANGVGQAAQVHEWLREIDLGAWDGLAIADVRRDFPGEYEKRGDDLFRYRTPAGESFSDLAARVIPSFTELVSASSGNLLIVGHAGVNRLIICHLLGLSPENLFDLPQEYGCLTVLDCSPDCFRLRCLNVAPGLGAMSSETHKEVHLPWNCL